MSSETVTKSNFKAKALEFFRNVETTGEPVVITDHGQPVIEVRPYRADRRPPLEILNGSVVAFKEPLPDDYWENLP